MRAFSDCSFLRCLELLIPEPLSFSLVTTQTEITSPRKKDLLVPLFFQNLSFYVSLIYLNRLKYHIIMHQIFPDTFTVNLG